jgi:nicotinamide riboside kinase
MIKRVALSGCGGSGKSTLATELSKELGWDRIEEGVRDYLKDNNIESLRGMTPERTMAMQIEMLQRKVEKESTTENFIADRSTADNVAYALRWCAWDLPESAMKEYIGTAYHHAYNTYDLIIHLPWGIIPLQNDGVRSNKLMYQYEIDALIRGILMKWELPHYICTSVTLDDRVNECLHIMNKKKLTTNLQGTVGDSIILTT